MNELAKVNHTHLGDWLFQMKGLKGKDISISSSFLVAGRGYFSLCLLAIKMWAILFFRERKGVRVQMTKRTAIIQSAIRLFQKNGIERTTVSQIVKEAEMAQGTFYLYFPSKLALMPAIAEEMVKILMQEIKTHTKKTDSVEETLTKVIDRIFLVNEKYSEMLAMIYSGLAATEHLKEWETVYEPIYEWISSVIEDGKESKTIHTSIPSHRIAKLMIGLIESAAEQVYLYEQTNTKEVKLQKEAVQQFLFHALQLERA